MNSNVTFLTGDCREVLRPLRHVAGFAVDDIVVIVACVLSLALDVIGMHSTGFWAEWPVSDFRGLSISQIVEALCPPFQWACAPFLTAYQHDSCRQL